MDLAAFQQIIAAALDAVVTIDDRGRVVDWNPQAEQVFGWKRDEAMGRLLASLIIPDRDRDAHALGLKQYRDTGQGPLINRRVEVSAIRKGGEEFPVELSICPIRGPGGASLFAGFARDLTGDRRPRRHAMLHTIESRLLQQASALATGADSLEEGLRTCLHAMCSITGWPVGHVWLLGSSGTQLQSTEIWQMANPRSADGLRRQSHGLQAAPGEGLPGLIWQTHEPQWVSGSAQDVRLVDRDDDPQALRSAFGFPVLVNGDVEVVLEFFSPEPITPDPALLLMVQTIGNLLGSAIERRRWQDERARLAAIVDSSYDAIVGQDLHGTIISWNHGAERMYGFSAEEAIGQSIGLILPPGVGSEEIEIRQAVRTGLQLTQFETVRRRKDGSLLEIAVTVSPIRDSKGRLMGASTIKRDITDLKHALRDLREREERLRLLMESTGEAFYGLNLEGECTFANTACARVLGYPSAADLLGRNMHELTHHHRRDGSLYPQSDCPIYSVLRGGPEVHSSEEVLFKKDGVSFPAEYWCSPVQRDGEIMGAVVIFEDITGRIEAARMKAELAAIVESSADAIIGKTLEGFITSWNHGAEGLYGYTAQEVVGKSATFLLPAGIGEEEPEIAAFSVPGQRAMRFETIRQHRDGRKLHVSIDASPILDPSGRRVGTSTIERDITSRIRREEELEEAKLAAESANQAKSEFLANISHELRTPMNAVLGMLGLALQEDLSEALRDYLRTAKDSAETLLLLLNDLLDLSRLEAGRFELDDAPFQLRETLDGALKTLAGPAHQKGIELVFDVDSEVPDHLLGDGFRLRQIITNLTGNAVKFTDRGEVVIAARIESLDNRQAVVRFSVRDTGIGISAPDQQRIFQPFTQVDSSSTRLRTGSGLGLAICQELVAKMGGRLWLESELGQGSTFHFTARFELDLERRDPSSAVPELAGLPVLIVDDNHSSLQTISTMLADWSMQPITLSNGHAALDLIRQKERYGSPIPLVIVDALMPELDGFSLIKALQQDGSTQKVATILMASSADRLTFKRRCEDLEVAAYLEKPVSGSDLLDSIITALKGPQYHRESFVQLAPIPQQKLRILVVEDTAANQQVVKAILRKRGHEVEIANNGREAVARAAEENLDVILMDVQMPIMDGLQATQAIRELQSSAARIPIIAMTAHARREDRRKCLQAGMDSYIAKPIDADKLFRIVESFASGSAVAPLRMVDSVDNMDVLHVINLAAALQRLQGDEELLRKLALRFLEESGPQVMELEQALRDGQAQIAERAAHSLRGMLVNFDALQAAEWAERMESLARQGNLEEAQALAAILRNQIRDVCQELKDAVVRKA